MINIQSLTCVLQVHLIFFCVSMYSVKKITKNYLILFPITLPFIGGSIFYFKKDSSTSENNSLQNEEYIYLPSEFVGKESFVGNLMDDSDQKTINMENNKQNVKSRLMKIFEYVVNSRNERNALKIVQSCDFNKSVQLARTPNVDFNLFRVPIKTNPILIRIDDKICNFELDELLVHLLKCTADIKGQSDCAKYFTEQTLVLFENNVNLNDIFFQTEYCRPYSNHTIISRYQELYFHAILQNLLSSKEHALCLLENGLLILFHKLRDIYPDKKVQNWIASCISALSVYQESHMHLYHTGWIKILVQWLNSSVYQLKLEAAKTLSNMANINESLKNSVFLLHPIYQNFSKLDCDIIFIHGLKGGVLKTWRQSDEMKNSIEYTECWPGSWLASDFENCRILALNYETVLSNWNINCPSEMYTLKDRSVQLMNDLLEAGVGQRPIIWVTHSMGGLLVKQMLSQINDIKSNDNSILEQTKGIVFYSVPHRGSEMAVWSQNIQRIISPSNHVLELRKNSPELLELNEKFIDLAQKKQFECLSLGETKMCTLLRSPIEWKALLVPQESANPGIGQFHVLDEDHFHICKPKSKNSENYMELKRFLLKLLKKDNKMEKHLLQYGFL